MRLLCLFLSCVLSLQGPTLPFPGPGASAVLQTPTFVAYAFVANTSCGSVCSSITSNALTLVANDFVFVFCRNNHNSVTDPMTMTSTPANTFTALTDNNLANNILTSSAYALNVAAGSTTFTCTPQTASTSMDMIVLQYHPAFLTTVDAQGLATLAVAGTNLTTNSTFSTTAKGLDIFCGSWASLGLTFTAGNIGGVGATLRGFSAATNNADSACEDRAVSTSQATVNANMTVSSAFKAAG